MVLLGVERTVPLDHVHAVVGEAETLAQHAPLQRQAVSDVQQAVIGQIVCNSYVTAVLSTPIRA